MRALNAVDTGFLTCESRQMPMHVGGLLLLRPPPGAPKDYLQQLYRDWTSVEEFRPPFNQKVIHPASRLALPHWDTDDDFDIEYHVRHSALPSPGRYRELFGLVSRLHGTLLDRTRPLWESTIIEGLESGQFAYYSKVHHSVVDGVAGMRLLLAGMSEDPDARNNPPPWSREVDLRRPQRKKVEPVELDLARIADVLQAQFGKIPGVARALARSVQTFQRPADTRMAFPFEAPASPLNTPITGARRFVAQSYSLGRIDRVRQVFGATVNDIVLALCASALRKYLMEYAGGVPDKPLTAMTPVSVRPTDGEDFGNAVTAVLVNLGTHLADPVERLRTIRASMADGKSLIRDLTFGEVGLFTFLTAAPIMTPMSLGLVGRFPPTNIVISNVPGPRKTLYWNGARLEGMYPVSIVTHGMAVNITVTSYGGNVDFGIVACRKTVPRVQRLIDFLEEGLVELEEAAGAERSSA
jgi:WS/DGAT/MGAT family acyltransferase